MSKKNLIFTSTKNIFLGRYLISGRISDIRQNCWPDIRWPDIRPIQYPVQPYQTYIQSIKHTFNHSNIHSIIQTYIQSFKHTFNHSNIRSINQTYIQSFNHTFNQSNIHSTIQLYVQHLLDIAIILLVLLSFGHF